MEAVHDTQDQGHQRGQSNGVVIQSYALSERCAAVEPIELLTRDARMIHGMFAHLAATTEVDNKSNVPITARNIGCFDPSSDLRNEVISARRSSQTMLSRYT